MPSRPARLLLCCFRAGLFSRADQLAGLGRPSELSAFDFCLTSGLLQCQALIINTSCPPYDTITCIQTVATSLVQAGGIKQLKQCIDSIVTSGRWKNVGTKQLQIAGELVACLLNKQAPPHSR